MRVHQHETKFIDSNKITPLSIDSKNEWLEMVFDTRIPSSSPSDTVKLRVSKGNFDLDWGDGSVVRVDITATNDVLLTHIYPIEGIYTVKLRGYALFQFAGNQNYDYKKLTNIKNWGLFRFEYLNQVFWGCENLTITARDSPHYKTGDSRFAFMGCSLISSLASNITTYQWITTQSMFQDTNFNDEIGSWDLSSCTNMTNMFLGTAMSQANCDALLIGWTRWSGGANILLKSNVSLHLGTTSYTLGGDAEAAFNYLVETLNWSITIL